ncbi:MAG TPA: TonB-dependent receptor, partial [Vicinamibacterales bacterium]|nr:TonB-dependent receptor [Vicinamibacterales bacterium]
MAAAVLTTRLVHLVLLACLAAVPQVAAQQVSGRITSTTSGTPVPARVEIVETRQLTIADAEGRFTVAVREAGRLTLLVSHEGYYVLRLQVDPGADPAFDVRLTPVVSLTDRVEVTAARAREGLDPASFTNLPQQAVEEAYWGQDPAVLLGQLVPGMYASNDSGNGIGYSYFSIRGFGQARTRVTLDGAPLNDAESGELFFIDLADFLATSGDIQVRRGVFGLSGLGGAVDITTAEPAPAPAFSVSTGAGSYGTRRLAVKWESGLVGGRWALSTRYSKIATDGYRDQSWVDMWNYYLALARHGEKSRLRVVLFGGPEKTHLAYDGVTQEALDGQVTGDAGRDRRANPITFPGEIDNFFQPHYQLVHDLALSPQTRVSQTAYVFTGSGSYDQFRANRRLFEYALPNVETGGSVITRADLVRRRNVDEWDAGWVPSLSHEAGRWGVDVRGEVRVHRARHFGEVVWARFYPAGIPPAHRYYDYRVGKNTGSVALEARLRPTGRLTLTGGVQAAHHGYSLSDDRVKGMSLSPRYNFVMPRAGAVWDLGRSSHVYAALARGMREPFFRSIYDPQDYYATPVTLAPEDVWDAEAGFSVQRSRGRARGNVFWMTFLNEIVYAGAQDDNGVPIYGNGARSRRVGAEVDASVRATGHVSFDAAVSLNRNTFTRYREFDFEGGAAVYDGNRIAGFPDVMASVAARAEWRAHRIRLSARRVGRF